MNEIIGELPANHKDFFHLGLMRAPLARHENCACGGNEMPGQAAIEIFAERSTLASAART
jgi:hypothetical protein